VRELAHLVERACLLARSAVLGVDLLPPEVALLDTAEPEACGSFERYTAEELAAARQGAVAAKEDEFLRGLMKLHEGNVSRAARSSGLHRTYLHTSSWRGTASSRLEVVIAGEREGAHVGFDAAAQIRSRNPPSEGSGKGVER
jgi:transcriptional regulator with GAF, ATPase, and Fis domain